MAHNPGGRWVSDGMPVFYQQSSNRALHAGPPWVPTMA